LRPKPELVALERLRDHFQGETRAICSAAISDQVSAKFGVRTLDKLPDARLGTLLVVGGGSRMDRAKRWRVEHSPSTRLIVIPSLWGSGAEVSPIVAITEGESKHIGMGPQFLPDYRAVWPELAASIPPRTALHACGDSWSHALEGFLSPLASDAVRDELAEVIRTLTALPLGNDPRWFEASARACAGQAKASVGLVHGIAHTLEGLLAEQGYPGWGHARLCATYLYPVMAYNVSCNNKWPEMAAKHRLDTAAIDVILRQLFDAEDYRSILPVLEAAWPKVLRDVSSRTNSALVRPAALEFFRKVAT
jgi:alcohol dehydrogenase class IV